MLVNECIPGCLDDQRRGAMARFYVEDLAAAGLGWMGWSLREGKAISTRRDRYDANGLDRQGFHAWFTKDGKLRGGLEFLLDPPKLKAPWLGRTERHGGRSLQCISAVSEIAQPICR